jgi:hypothetical protein
MNADTLELLSRPSPLFLARGKKRAGETIGRFFGVPDKEQRRAEAQELFDRNIPPEFIQTIQNPETVNTLKQLPNTVKVVNDSVGQLQAILANNPAADMAAYKDEFKQEMKDHMSNEFANAKKELMGGGGDGKGFGAFGVGIQKFLGDNWPLLFGALAAGGGGYALDRGSGGSGMGGALGGISLLGLLYLFATQTEAGKKMFGPVFDPAYWADTQTKADADAATQQQTEQKPLEGTPVTKPELLLTTEQQQQAVGTQVEVSTAKAEQQQQQSAAAQHRPATLPTENFLTRKTNNLSLLINKSSASSCLKIGIAKST